MSSYQYRNSHHRDYKNPLHLDVVGRYLRRMGTKRFQTRLRRVWNRFIPHESQASIYTTKVLWILCLIHRQKSIFWYKNTAIINVSQLSNRRHPNKEVARNFTCPCDDAKDGYFVAPKSECHLPRLQYYQYKNASVTTVQVSMYDMLVPWILCCMFLYAHKSRFNVRDKKVT